VTVYDFDGYDLDDSYPDAATVARWEADAHRTQLLRQRNLARGWHPNGWHDPQQALRQLEGQRDADPLTSYERAREHQEALAGQRETMERDTQDAELIELRRRTGFHPEYR